MPRDAGPSKPPWIKVALNTGATFGDTREVLDSLDVSTVCEEALCPNRPECWENGTATFQVLGTRCTRSCGFCAVDTGPLESPDPKEPDRVAGAAEGIGLEYAVLTSVTRDDLPDGGGGHIARCVSALREICDVEVLVPDFRGHESALETVVDAGPEVVGHNLETVEELQRKVRGPAASYDRSLRVLERAKREDPSLVTKSSLMLGLGEEVDQVRKAMEDLRERDVDLLALGQYLRPTEDNLPVERYVSPARFDALRREGLEMGFRHVEAGPFVRSSYKAGTKLGSIK